ncbi:unnamed protein product [Rotaria sp. Silwood2]|nr:unnamed protein product [Rotaria sp. Silwood2]
MDWYRNENCQIVSDIVKGIRKFNIDVQLVVADLLASAKITFINGHAGYYACGNCLLEGSRCLRHQHILYTWSDYFRAQPHIRTQENIDSCAVYAELSGSQNTSSAISQRSSTQQEYNSRRHLTTARFVDSPIVSPSIKQKHNEMPMGDALILEKPDHITEKLTLLSEGNAEKMKKMFKSQQKMKKNRLQICSCTKTRELNKVYLGFFF